MTKPSKSISEIDRLIELASAEPASSAIRKEASLSLVDDHSVSDDRLSQQLAGKDRKESEPSMWRVLLQLRVLLPYLARLLPLVERSLLGTNVTSHLAAGKADNSHFEQAVAGVQSTQQNLAAQLKSQAEGIAYLQEQLTWIGKAVEKQLAKEEEVLAEVAALKKRMTTWAVVLIVLLVSLIGLTTFALIHHPG